MTETDGWHVGLSRFRYWNLTGFKSVGVTSECRRGGVTGLNWVGVGDGEGCGGVAWCVLQMARVGGGGGGQRVIEVASIKEIMEKKFVVKLLNATEIQFQTGPEMRTMGHLRTAVEMKLLLPPPFQRYGCKGRRYWEDTPDDLSLEEVLAGTTEGVVDGVPHERIVWLLWMAMTDCITIERGRLFLASEVEQKRARMTRWANSPPFECVTLRQYLTLDRRAQCARRQHRKRKRKRTDEGVACARMEMGMRALSSDSEDEGCI